MLSKRLQLIRKALDFDPQRITSALCFVCLELYPHFKGLTNEIQF